MRLAHQLKNYVRHWPLGDSQIVIFLALFAFIPSSSFANEDHLNCLDKAKDVESKYMVCMQKVEERCSEMRKELLDYQPQIACYMGYSNAVLEVTKDLQDKFASDPKDFYAKIRAAALRYFIRVGEARCDFQDETIRRPDGSPAEFYDMSKAMCYSGAHSTAYWYAIVNDRIK